MKALLPFGTMAKRHSVTSQGGWGPLELGCEGLKPRSLTSLRTLQLRRLTRQLATVLYVQMVHRIANLTEFIVKLLGPGGVTWAYRPHGTESLRSNLVLLI